MWARALVGRGEGGDGESARGLVDERGRDALESMAETEEMDRLIRGVGALPEMEGRVIRMRFGMAPHEPMTQREVASSLGVSR